MFKKTFANRKQRSRVQDIRIMNQLFPAADAIAAADGVNDTGAEHLLIAALDLDTGSARRAFERAGVDPDDFAPAVRAQRRAALLALGMKPIPDDSLDQHLPPSNDEVRPHRGSPSSHEFFRRVVDLVRQERSQLYGAYFVLVAAESTLGTTARALQHMTVDPAALAEAARVEIDQLNTP